MTTPQVLRETQVPQDVYTKEEKALMEQAKKPASISNDITPGS